MSEDSALSAPENDWPELFLMALAELGNVAGAARVAGVSRDTPYKRRAKDPGFAAAWKTAEEEGTDALVAKARELALAGNPTLLIFLLKCHRPEVYGDRSAVEHGGAVEIKVRYVDVDRADAPEAAPGPAGGPEE